MVLTGAAGVGLVETRVVPGRGRLHRALGLTGPDGVVPDTAAGPAVSGTFASAARRTPVGWSIVWRRMLPDQLAFLGEHLAG